ncbi:MAG: threonine/serine dehydratase [Thermoprotei archaeon]|nr:MAG: threonine/serine dehydratase [Thermoprotei archaeon]
MRNEDVDIKNEVLNAERRIRGYVRVTPIEYSHYLSSLGSAKVYLKLENLQITGSFKIRGVMNKLLSMSREELSKGVVTASTGNHGVAFAYAVGRLDLKGIVFLPKGVSKAKVEDILAYDVKVVFYGNDCLEAELYAKKYAEHYGMTYISPYNDIKVIAGQGTIGIELMNQLSDLDVVLVPVGGGGLISGIAGFLKSIRRDIKVIGCQPLNSPVMYESIKAGRIVSIKVKPTIADAVAGGIEPDAISFELCKKYVDDFILLTEDEIKEAIKLMLSKHHILIEGAAALPIAAYVKAKDAFRNKKVVLIVTGRRIELEHLKDILCR